ncbi:MAG: hypothetical protein HQL53_07820 [Magnetococcales bacterium]|nr:hypothetical protein [Magnetococcales bacterium]
MNNSLASFYDHPTSKKAQREGERKAQRAEAKKRAEEEKYRRQHWRKVVELREQHGLPERPWSPDMDPADHPTTIVSRELAEIGQEKSIYTASYPSKMGTHLNQGQKSNSNNPYIVVANSGDGWGNDPRYMSEDQWRNNCEPSSTANGGMWTCKTPGGIMENSNDKKISKISPDGSDLDYSNTGKNPAKRSGRSKRKKINRPSSKIESCFMRSVSGRCVF